MSGGPPGSGGPGGPGGPGRGGPGGPNPGGPGDPVPPGTGAPAGDAPEEDPSETLSRTLVLNALLDIRGEGTVLADDDSRDIVAAAVDDALDDDELARLDEAVADLDTAPDEDPDAETGAFLDDVAGAVLDAMVADGVRATLVHDAPLAVPAREAAVYTFMVSRDPGALADLDLPAAVRDEVDAGAEAVADGAFEDAAERFDAAIDAAVDASGGATGGSDADGGPPAGATVGTGALAARVLAGFACHLAGEDAAAVDYVEETLHLDTGVWTAKLVGYAADHRYPEKFRDGKLGARAFFRWSTDIPEDADVTVSAGPAGGEPEPLEGRWECRPLPALWPETTVRVEVAGDLPDLPAVQTYYVATGVADLEVFEARSVENLLLTGPATANATEQVRFE